MTLINTMKYLFEVEYKDGTFFKQNAEDVSLTDPKRSAFFDIKQNEVKRFTLAGGNTFSVDLTDGHFEVNGVPFRVHSGDLKDFRLIYWRQHTHTFGMKLNEQSHEIAFCIGWQTNDEKGQKVQRGIKIK